MTLLANPTTHGHVEYLKRVHEGDLEEIKRFQHTKADRLYDDTFLNTDRPRIRGMLRKIHELGIK